MSVEKRIKFTYYQSFGKPTSTLIERRSGILLIGGAEGGESGEYEATEWLLDRARGGNYLVLRFNGIGRQADWIYKNFSDRLNSAAELSINSREAANDTEVIQYLNTADILFFAGGDQSKYKEYWEGTAVEETINRLIREKKVPVAGTSAGMAILGDYYYAPDKEEVIGSEILNDPFHDNTRTFYRSDFIEVPFLKGVITDTHLDRVGKTSRERRYGRIFGFLARNLHDNGDQFPVRAIGLEEGAFVAIDENGIAKVFGNDTDRGQDAYFLQPNGQSPERIQPGQAVIWDNEGQAVKVYRIAGTRKGSGSFDLNDHSTADGGTWEYWYTTGGINGFRPNFYRD